MIRTQVQLEESQIQWLRATAQDTGLSMSQLVRDSISFFQKQKNNSSIPSGKYFIQAGSFSQSPNTKYLSSIKSLGLPYKVRHETRYKVLVGAYKSEKSARIALKKVRKHINAGAFLVNNTRKMKSEDPTLY